MKTPMQEMLEWVRATLPMDLDTPILIEEKVQSLLEKEKEQMRLIYNGILQNVGTIIKQSDLPTFEEYYNKTYRNNK